ncbi:helix-turn-helix domain-containing protein [Spirillospora sp. NPDC029432]|uniref:TetR/AcrR family transcriptional regulator n=1 Tax=Spirillospora sp. NPDC029432 TaxID=3154599 RepID=UPI003452B0F0
MSADRTRARILDIAAELFRAQGYAGTSIADIAKRLGSSKAALYYHFASKEKILDALLADALKAHAGIADLAGDAGPEAVLAAAIDMVAGAGGLLAIFGDDPSVQAVLAGRAELRERDDRIVAALAGSGPGGRVRALAAFAVAKEGTKDVMAANGGVLPDGARAELLAAALRALNP